MTARTFTRCRGCDRGGPLNWRGYCSDCEDAPQGPPLTRDEWLDRQGIDRPEELP